MKSWIVLFETTSFLLFLESPNKKLLPCLCILGWLIPLRYSLIKLLLWCFLFNKHFWPLILDSWCYLVNRTWRNYCVWKRFYWISISYEFPPTVKLILVRGQKNVHKQFSIRKPSKHNCISYFNGHITTHSNSFHKQHSEHLQ